MSASALDPLVERLLDAGQLQPIAAPAGAAPPDSVDTEVPPTRHFVLADARLLPVLRAVFARCCASRASFTLEQTARGHSTVCVLDDDGAPAARLRLWCHDPHAPASRARPHRASGALRRPLRAPRTLAVVGPDGSGKTTLIDGLRVPGAPMHHRVQRFKRFFRRPLFHLVRHEERDVREEKLRAVILPVGWVFFMLSRTLGAWRRPVLLDRYFYDYLVIDLRCGDRQGRRIPGYARWSRFVPHPGTVVVAMCPEDVIRARKDELSAAAIGQIYATYLDQIVRGVVPRTLFCHTGLEPAVSLAHLRQFLKP